MDPGSATYRLCDRGQVMAYLASVSSSVKWEDYTGFVVRLKWVNTHKGFAMRLITFLLWLMFVEVWGWLWRPTPAPPLVPWLKQSITPSEGVSSSVCGNNKSTCLPGQLWGWNQDGTFKALYMGPNRAEPRGKADTKCLGSLLPWEQALAYPSTSFTKSETPAYMVVHACNSSYSGGRGKRILSSRPTRPKVMMKLSLTNKIKVK
jgi:hypothetical protein